MSLRRQGAYRLGPVGASRPGPAQPESLQLVSLYIGKKNGASFLCACGAAWARFAFVLCSGITEGPGEFG